MVRETDRRSLLRTAGATALTVAAGKSVAQATDIRGTITFAAGVPIPEGYLKVRLEDPAVRNRAQRRLAEIRIKTRGADKLVSFMLPSPRTAIDRTAKLEVVVRLEREDGWLIARGSDQFKAGAPANVTLHTTQY